MPTKRTGNKRPASSLAIRHLRDEGIGPALQKKAKIKIVPGAFGTTEHITFPYFDRSGKKIVDEAGHHFVRRRLLGATNDDRKYSQDMGTANHAYLAPFAKWTGKHKTLHVVEGEKDAILCCNKKVLAIGIAGHSSWRNRDGVLVEEISSLLSYKPECLILVPDNDYADNSLVQNGWNSLALVLDDMGATVTFRFLPPGDAKAKGAGDFIRKFGKARFLKLPLENPDRDTLETYRRQRASDVGNANRLVAELDGHARYVHAQKRWYFSNGGRWIADDLERIQECAKRVPQLIFSKEVDKVKDPDKRKQLVSHAMRSDNERPIRNMIALARSDPKLRATPSIFDNEPMLLGVRNGVIDLSTGKLRPYVPDDFISMTSPVAYDAKASCPLWLSFLDTVTDGNKKLISYLQRAVGYSLTGLTKEQCLFFIFGHGRNGKTTFITAIQNILGDYAKTTPIDTLMARHGDSGPSNDLARLHRTRMAIAAETEAGKRLAETKTKQMTGSDKITARFLYGEYFELKPEFKLWILGNYKPTVTGTDEGIWRRLRLIPFNVHIKKCDLDFMEKLEAEYSGILNWALAGCQQWQKKGLEPQPSVMVNAVTEYRTDQDVVAQWIEECCDLRSDLRTSTTELYRDFQTWTWNASEYTFSQSVFSRRLSEKSELPRERRGNTRGFIGIGLKKRSREDRLTDSVGKLKQSRGGKRRKGRK